MDTSHNLKEVIVALENHVIAVEVTCCYRACVKTDKVVFAVTIAVEGDFRPNRASYHRRDSLSTDNTHPRLNPRQPCLEGWRQIRNSVSHVTLTSFAVQRRTHSVCSVAK